MDIVIGSGPSGVAVTEALLGAGRPVLMLDAGMMLPPDRRAQKEALAARDPSSWTASDLAFMKGPPDPRGQAPVKRSFGSDFPYVAPPGTTPVTVDAAAISPSFAMGGLSTVWGSALLPFRDQDTIGWPVRSADLSEGYQAALRLLPLSAVHDDLEGDFPLHRRPQTSLPPSRQAQRLLSTLGRHRARLRAEGVTFGQARLAVDAPACVKCGLCLLGCPHDLIYSSRTTLDRHRESGLSYTPGVIVRAVSETADGVEVHAVRSDGSPCGFKGERVFLAAGVVNTAEILLRSMGRRDRPVRIKDAQYFLIPTMRWRGTSGVQQERLHTLCQAFLELDDPTLSPFTIHMQAYTYSVMFRDLLLAKVGSLRRAVPFDAILGRLGVLQSYLHSDHSGTIEATLTGRADAERMTLVGRTQPATAAIIAGVVKKLGRLTAATGLIPVKAMIEVTEPGRGFHSGGSFPMARDPGEDETDLLGRPKGFSRVHLVDSSTFPSIPATTITLALMANAYRIGAAVAAADFA